MTLNEWITAGGKYPPVLEQINVGKRFDYIFSDYFGTWEIADGFNDKLLAIATRECYRYLDRAKGFSLPAIDLDKQRTPFQAAHFVSTYDTVYNAANGKLAQPIADYTDTPHAAGGSASKTNYTDTAQGVYYTAGEVREYAEFWKNIENFNRDLIMEFIPCFVGVLSYYE